MHYSAKAADRPPRSDPVSEKDPVLVPAAVTSMTMAAFCRKAHAACNINSRTELRAHGSQPSRRSPWSTLLVNRQQRRLPQLGQSFRLGGGSDSLESHSSIECGREQCLRRVLFRCRVATLLSLLPLARLVCAAVRLWHCSRHRSIQRVVPFERYVSDLRSLN